MATLTTSSLVARDAIAAAQSMVVDLSFGVALTADTVDEIITWKTSAGSDDGVPNFIVLARFVTDSVGGIIDFSRGAQAARVANQVVSFTADAFTINVLFVGVAGRNAQAEVLDVSNLAGAALGFFIIGGVHNASVAGTISHLMVLRQTHTFLLAQVENSFMITRDTADAQTLIINFVPGTLTADAIDWVVTSFAAALAILEDFVDTTAADAVTS